MTSLGASISPCGRYRYRLEREWGSGPKLTFIMLNPSIADADVDDPTVRRCARFGRDAGYSGVVIGNLFAWRSTDPEKLKQVPDPIGPDNDSILQEIILGAPEIVCAWGVRGAYLNRDQHVIHMIRCSDKIPFCLRMTGEGHPAHPLYLPASLRPIPLRL